MIVDTPIMTKALQVRERYDCIAAELKGLEIHILETPAEYVPLLALYDYACFPERSSQTTRSAVDSQRPF